MYVFKATYFNTKPEKEEEKFIDDLYGLETELECYESVLF